MICKSCKKEGKTSRVFPDGCSKTLMGWSMYYDEKGLAHHHDPNTITEGFRCSNGHMWGRKRHGGCWCGWSGGKEEEV